MDLINFLEFVQKKQKEGYNSIFEYPTKNVLPITGIINWIKQMINNLNIGVMKVEDTPVFQKENYWFIT